MNIDKLPGIYAIVNMTNGQQYVGSSVNMNKRCSKHRYHLRTNQHCARHLQASWNKYGEAAFQFIALEIVEETNFLIEREQFYLDTLKPVYNARPIAERTASPTDETRELLRTRHLGKVASEETKRKLSEAQKGIKKGPISTQGRANMSAGQMGKKLGPHSEEHRARLSAAHKGKKMPPMTEKTLANRAKAAEARRGIKRGPMSEQALANRAKAAEARRGIKRGPMPEERKASISAAKKGYKHTEETKAKMRATKAKLKTNRISAQINDVKVFDDNPIP